MPKTKTVSPDQWMAPASVCLTADLWVAIRHQTSCAKKAANDGPVIITDRGKPAHVLLSIKDYQHLTGILDSENITDLLAIPDRVPIEFEAPKLPGKFTK